LQAIGWRSATLNLTKILQIAFQSGFYLRQYFPKWKQLSFRNHFVGTNKMIEDRFAAIMTDVTIAKLYHFPDVGKMVEIPAFNNHLSYRGYPRYGHDNHFSGEVSDGFMCWGCGTRRATKR
jgi:hypothetical protein